MDYIPFTLDEARPDELNEMFNPLDRRTLLHYALSGKDCDYERLYSPADH